jgi:hypothetical protein
MIVQSERLSLQKRRKEMKNGTSGRKGGSNPAAGSRYLWTQTAGALSLVMIALLGTGCSSATEMIKQSLSEETFANLPASELSTYVIDLSGSTYPLDQIEALGSGIQEFLTGKTIGDPFAEKPEAPKGLSIQFITENSANAPRIILASAETGPALYTWMKNNAPNTDQAKQIWNGFINARSTIWDSKQFDNSSCAEEAITAFGQQGITPELLREPAQIICKDAAKSFAAVKKMNDFVANPNVPMGSDVFGALETAINNLNYASEGIPVRKKIIVLASDLVDTTNQFEFGKKLQTANNPEDACTLGEQDSTKEGDQLALQDFSILLVGLGNSKTPTATIEKVRSYWFCYLESAGAEVNEVSDLSGY